MNTLENGHVYDLNNRGGREGRGPEDKTQTITFVNREPGHEHDGTTTQEVIRSLIDRTHYCDNCLPWSGNELIIKHLRMALALHEARALLRKVERGEIMPEMLATGHDGHFVLTNKRVPLPEYYRNFDLTTTETGSLNIGKPCHTPLAAE